MCGKKTDIIFVVDRSASIRPADYDKIRTFIQNLGKKLRIGVKNDRREVIGQGAVVTFSEEGEKRITLKESKIPGRFSKTVKYMPGPQSGGRTKTHRGLAVADEQVAIKEAGLRADEPDVNKIIMVITDGAQTRESVGFVYVKDAVKPFFKRGMEVFAVGVNLKDQKAKDQLRDMVKVPENVFMAESFNELIASIGKITGRICPGKVALLVSRHFHLR